MTRQPREVAVRAKLASVSASSGFTFMSEPVYRAVASNSSRSNHFKARRACGIARNFGKGSGCRREGFRLSESSPSNERGGKPQSFPSKKHSGRLRADSFNHFVVGPIQAGRTADIMAIVPTARTICCLDLQNSKCECVPPPTQWNAFKACTTASRLMLTKLPGNAQFPHWDTS